MDFNPETPRVERLFLILVPRSTCTTGEGRVEISWRSCGADTRFITHRAQRQLTTSRLFMVLVLLASSSPRTYERKYTHQQS